MRNKYMKKANAQLQEIMLVGIKTRTNNGDISAENLSNEDINQTIQKYFSENISGQIQNRKNPNVTFAVYTNYESDYRGDYTYFIGQEVTSFEGQNENLEKLVIPAQNYIKFTNEPGPMPSVCTNMWKNIWSMNSEDLGGERAYIADFEIYDERSADYSNAVLDIYLGIKNISTTK